MTPEALQAVIAAGVAKVDKARRQPMSFLVSAALAGAFIAVGTLASLLCGAWFYADSPALAKLLCALAFSTALILIVLLGGELFTGANLVMGVALYDGRVKIGQAIQVWLMCYLGNLVGILLFSLLLVGSGASGELLGAYLAVILPGKLSLSWSALLLRGVLCNFLVCLGVFAGFRLKSECARILVIALVIFTFVLTGLEHSIANLCYFSLSALLIPGADFLAMGHNLLFVTLGNLLGGAVLLGLPLYHSVDHTQA